MGYSQKQLCIAIFGIALIFVAASFIAVSHMSDGKIDPFVGMPIGVFLSVFVLVFVLQLRVSITVAVQFIRHVVRTHRLSGFEAPRWKTRVPKRVLVMLVVVKLAALTAVMFLVALSIGAALSSFVISVGEFTQIVFRALIQALVWGAFTHFLTALPILATQIRDRS
jgi:hypothetical protein